MQVRLYATLRPIVGGRSVTLDLPPGAVRDVLDALLAAYPDLRPRLLDEAGQVRPYVAVMVGGRDIRHLGGLDAPVDADSQIDIFPPVAGGAR